MGRTAPHVGVAVSLAAATTVGGASPPLTTVAYYGGPAPVGAGVFGTLRSPEITSAGQLFFHSEVAPAPGVGPLVQTLWWRDGGAWTIVAREDTPAPGIGGGVEFAGFAPFVRAGGPGQVAFRAVLQGPGVTSANQGGIWAGPFDSPFLIVRDGGPAAGLPGLVHAGGNLSQLIANGVGEVAFCEDLAGPGVNSTNDIAIWAGGQETLGLVGREGSPVNPSLPGVLYASMTNAVQPDLSMNDAGQLAYSMNFTGPGVTPSDDYGVMFGTPGAIDIVARRGSPAPGIPGMNYGRFSTARVNEAGTLAYFGELNPPGMTSPAGEAAWLGAVGSPQLLARTGTPVPGGGANIGRIMNLSLSDNSECVLHVALGNNPGTSGPSAILAGTPGDLSTIAQSGQAAPGTEPGTVFSSEHFFREPGIGPSGQVAFVGSLQGPGVTPGTSGGLWATDPLGILTLIARTGDEITLAPGDVRTIQVLSLRVDNVFGPGRAEVFSADGLLTFTARFTDQSYAVFVTQVPGPTAPTLLLIAGACSVGRRRPRPVASAAE